MKFNLKKESLLNLSDDAEVLHNDLTPQVGGGRDEGEPTAWCNTISPGTDYWDNCHSPGTDIWTNCV